MRTQGWRLIWISFAFALSLASRPAHALDDPTALLSSLPDVIRPIGMILNHRPFQGATPLGPSGITLMAEATLGQAPQSFQDALDTSIKNIPAARLMVHKGMSDKVDAGISFLGFAGYLLAGADLKFVLSHPEEGPSFALRTSYTYGKLDFVKVDIFSMQLLAGRKLDFAEPYLGLGFNYIAGKLTYSYEVVPGVSVPIVQTTNANGLFAFIGTAFALGPTGLRLSIEGGYAPSGANHLGLAIGVGL